MIPIYSGFRLRDYYTHYGVGNPKTYNWLDEKDTRVELKDLQHQVTKVASKWFETTPTDFMPNGYVGNMFQMLAKWDFLSEDHSLNITLKKDRQIN